MPPAAAFEEPLAELRHRIAEFEGFPADGARDRELALGVGDRVYALEYATYSVISPEGCAADLDRLSVDELRAGRYEKFGAIGARGER